MSTTVILFWVRVPVLSEQIIWVHPKVSTAVSFLIKALRLLIAVTPIDRITVTTAGKPSGIAATAKATAIINVLSTVPKMSPLFEKIKSLATPKTNTITQTAMTIFVRVTDNSLIFF